MTHPERSLSAKNDDNQYLSPIVFIYNQQTVKGIHILVIDYDSMHKLIHSAYNRHIVVLQSVHNSHNKWFYNMVELYRLIWLSDYDHYRFHN